MNFDPHHKGMHPSDKRNLIIFILASLILWFAFEHFVIGPKVAEVKKQQAIAQKNAPVAQKDKADTVVIPRAEKLAQGERLSIDNPEIVGTFSTTGNRIDDISLKKYMTELHGSEPVVLMSPSETEFPLYVETGWLADSSITVPNAKTEWVVQGNKKLTAESPVTMTWSNGKGLVFERTYSLDDHYLVTVTHKVINQSGSAVELYPYSSLTRRGFPTDHGKGIGYEGPLGYIADELHEIPFNDLVDEGDKKFTALNGWIGFGEKYWLSAIIPQQMEQNSFSFKSTPNLKDPKFSVYQVDVRGDKTVVEAGQSAEEITYLFMGAKKVKLLESYEEKIGVKHFDLAVDFGVLYFLTKPLYFLLTMFNNWVGNFGVAIILLTFVVRGAVYPLASKSYRSFAGLKIIAPKMAEIKERYGHDKPRLHQELVKLYETEKVNPMAGCFPILLQIPIFFAVYKVMAIAVEMRHAPFFGWIEDLSAKDPLTIFNLFGLIPWDPPSFLMIGPWSILMLVLMLIQKELNPPPQDKIQKDLIAWMPWLMTYVLSSFASGLVIYWAFSNLLSVLQQAYIMRSMGVPIYLFSPDAAKEHANEYTQKTQDAIARAREEKEKENKSQDKSKSGKSE
jgi:YidC/Oxa1 family membrane protein insertase